MSWWVSGISAAVSLVGGVVEHRSAKKAQSQAEDDADKDSILAQRAAQWADKEGEGQGLLGEVKLSVDEEVQDSKVNLKAGKSAVRI